MKANMVFNRVLKKLNKLQLKKDGKVNMSIMNTGLVSQVFGEIFTEAMDEETFATVTNE